MLATRRVDAGIAQPQPLDWFSSDNVGLDDFFYIGEGHAAIPHAFRIDHDVRTMFALVQASGLIRSHSSFQSALRQLLLEHFLQFGVSRRITASPRMSRWALVPTDENMLLELWHQNNVQDVAKFRRRPKTQ
jgi:hypothetical protein